MKQIRFIQLVILYAVLSIIHYSSAFALPEGFVYLKDIDSTIIKNLRYYSNENFIGRTIDGYESDEVILTTQAAKALSNAQQELLKDGYSLVVYDAYRPEEAVDLFVKWGADINDQSQKEKYYPLIDKADIFKLKYIMTKSGHSRGSTIDLTIIKKDNNLKPIIITKRRLKDQSQISFLDDNTVDMGSSFDLFSTASNHDSDLIDSEALKNRNYLRAMMKKHGFNDYKEEWWHYTLKDEPFPDTYFNFKVK